MTATPTPADVPGLGEPVAWGQFDVDGKLEHVYLQPMTGDLTPLLPLAAVQEAVRLAVEADRKAAVASLRRHGQARMGEQFNDRMNSAGRTYLAAAYLVESGHHEDPA